MVASIRDINIALVINGDSFGIVEPSRRSQPIGEAGSAITSNRCHIAARINAANEMIAGISDINRIGYSIVGNALRIVELRCRALRVHISGRTVACCRRHRACRIHSANRVIPRIGNIDRFVRRGSHASQLAKARCRS